MFFIAEKHTPYCTRISWGILGAIGQHPSVSKYNHLEHLHPAALKGLGKPFDAALEKNMPHPSPIPLFKLPGLFKLPAPLTILAGERCSLLRPHSGFFLASATCVKATRNIPDTFSIWRERKQLTVGECRSKKFGCKLGALQRAFLELAFLRQGGDALTCWYLSVSLYWN